MTRSNDQQPISNWRIRIFTAGLFISKHRSAEHSQSSEKGQKHTYVILEWSLMITYIQTFIPWKKIKGLFCENECTWGGFLLITIFLFRFISWMKIKGFSQASAQDYATSEAISLHFLYQTRSLASCGKVDLNLIDFEGHYS